MRRSVVRSVGALAASTLFSGCWLQVGFGPQRQRWNGLEDQIAVSKAGMLQPAWTVTVPHLASLVAGSPFEDAVVSEPIVRGGTVFVAASVLLPSQGGPPPCCPATASVGVNRYDLATGAFRGATYPGSVQTRLDWGGESVELGPTVLGDDVWLSFGLSSGGNVAQGQRLIDPDTGAYSPVPWSSDIGQRGIPAQVGDLVVAPVYPGGPGLSLIAYDRATGTTRWSADAGSDEVEELAVGGGLAVVNDAHIVRSFALDGCGAPICTERWSVDVGSDHQYAQPVVGADGQVFVTAGPAGASQLLSLDGASGAVQWSADLGEDTDPQPLAVTDEAVYVSTGGATPQLQVFAAQGCGAATCAPLWTSELDGAGVPTVAGGVLYLAVGNVVHVFDAAGCGAASCSELTSLTAPDAIAKVSVANGHVLVMTRTWRLTAFAL